jgi:hypothetical protein
MRSLSNRVAVLEQAVPDEFIEVLSLRHFYGDTDARPVRMTRDEFQKRTLDDFYREEGQG